MENNNYISDIEFVDLYIDKCLYFINPLIFRQINERGLYHIINYLPKDKEEARAVARARMAKTNKYFDDAELTGIFNTISRVEFLKKELMLLNMTDVHKTLPILNEITELSNHIKDYYKK